MRWLWWVLGLAVAGGTVYVISSSTGKRVAQKDACVDDMPEPMRSQARDAIAKSDVPRLLAYSKQASKEGWACAARQLSEAAGAGANATATIDLVPDPPRSSWQALLDRAVGEADPGGDLISLLEVAAEDARSRGYLKVRDALHDASRDVRRTIRLARITEPPVAATAQAALTAATDPKGYKPTKATIDGLDQLAKQLDALGYVGAATEARSMRDAAIALSKPTILFVPPAAEFGPILATYAPGADPFDTLPADLRATVDAAMAGTASAPLYALLPVLSGDLAWKKAYDAVQARADELKTAEDTAVAAKAAEAEKPKLSIAELPSDVRATLAAKIAVAKNWFEPAGSSGIDAARYVYDLGYVHATYEVMKMFPDARSMDVSGSLIGDPGTTGFWASGGV